MINSQNKEFRKIPGFPENSCKIPLRDFRGIGGQSRNEFDFRFMPQKAESDAKEIRYMATQRRNKQIIPKRKKHAGRFFLKIPLGGFPPRGRIQHRERAINAPMADSHPCPVRRNFARAIYMTGPVRGIPRTGRTQPRRRALNPPMSDSHPRPKGPRQIFLVSAFCRPQVRTDFLSAQTMTEARIQT